MFSGIVEEYAEVVKVVKDQEKPAPDIENVRLWMS